MSKRVLGLIAVILAGGGAGVYWFIHRGTNGGATQEGFIGSASCRSCHEKFYELWAPSHHGTAMQPYTAEFARAELTPQQQDIKIGSVRYRAEIQGKQGSVVAAGPDGETRYPIEWVMGGKDVYYFLTPLERGRLQVLPIAYDVREKRWYDTAASGVRHFPDLEDEPLHWTERPYTFNTSCYSCHVSQLTTNYDLKSDSYHTMWAEPGINCETCHGPAAEHVRFCSDVSEEACREDPRIIVVGKFTPPKMNSLCAPCHAKMVILSTKFQPGDRYFDHFDLITLEDRDFYPDGRDLGENYTYTLWRMSPCAKSGQLDCNHCHTSSGRNRFPGEQANRSCLPCHQERVNNPTPHTHHRADSAGSKCIACHMPMTSFARMVRTDHSMHPPTPAASAEFSSPDACVLCHTDRDARWADRVVRKWHPDDYQAPYLYRARLLDEARKRDWHRLDEILAYITNADRDEIYANSFIRLLRYCEDDRKWPALIQALKDPSPLIRASAADSLLGHMSPDAVAALVEATRDDYRVVRVRAAAALARVPPQVFEAKDRAAIEKATAEFIASMKARPDDAASQTNLANYYLSRGQMETALSTFDVALKLNPQSIPTLVNAALAYNLAGRNDKAEALLRRAVKVDPKNAAAHFNLGLLLGEEGRKEEAKQALRAALAAEPNLAAAAYNLCVLESETDLDEAIGWCREAVKNRPEEAKYGYTLGFYLAKKGDQEAAIRALKEVVRQHPNYSDAYMLLGRIYQSRGNEEAAAAMYRRAREGPES